LSSSSISLKFSDFSTGVIATTIAMFDLCFFTRKKIIVH
jgi:hypothetical protein